MRLKRRVLKQPRVEMLPLIDIVFLLLIFFIYAMLSMAVHRGLELDLPESSSAQVSKDEILSISVKRAGTQSDGLLVLINETPVGVERLGLELQQMASINKKGQALVFAEESVSYQQLFQVLDQIKIGGIDEISLQANKARD